MHDLTENRLARTFAELRSSGKKTVLPFITAGYPDLDTTAALLAEFAARGVRICELGIPFSDPIADGAVIQASYTDALAGCVTSDKVFEMVGRFRENEVMSLSLEKRTPTVREGTDDRRTRQDQNLSLPAINRPLPHGRGSLPGPGNPPGFANGSYAGAGQLSLIAMVSYSIVFRHDWRKYVAGAAAAGFDGLIIPDLPLEEAGDMEEFASSQGLANIMLISPTTPAQRRLEIARHSRGFIYFMSVAGITGERDRLPADTIEAVSELRKHTQTPVCVGFGVSNAATVAEVCQVADGAIVGSAIVKRIADARASGAPRASLVKQVGQFVSDLLSPLA